MTDAVARLGAALADRYTIERELGAGGMATVYLAHDVKHDRRVALKVLRPELSAILGGDRFLHEIKTTANLQHPHILSLFDSGEADGLVYYVMPYVEGESLRDRLTREKQLPVDDAVRIAREVADALDYAHQHGIVHRDIKPENILLHGGHAQVADFGIALAASRSEGGARMTETGMSLGTPHYMSPEQAMGEREITPKADIYALGCVLYEMLTAEPPFVGATAQAIIARVMTEEPRSLTLQRHTIPPNVEAAVRMALEKLPADRFASAAEFGAALGNATFAAAASARTHGRTDQRRTDLPTYRPAALFPWAIVVALAAWLVVLMRRPDPPSPPTARFVVGLGAVRPVALRPQVSPDGSRIAFVGQDSLGVARLYLRALDREDPVVVPGSENIQNSPLFSPDGQWLLFRQGNKLRRMAITGGAVAVVCDVAGGFNGVTWGEGDRIVFVATDTIFEVPATGGTPRVILAADTAAEAASYRSVDFLPGGAMVVAERLNPRTGSDLVTISLNTREVKSLGIAGINPHYVEGGWLLYTDAAGTVFAAPFDGRRGRVTGAAEPLIEKVAINVGFARMSASRSAIAWFAGGSSATRQIVVVDRRGQARVLPVRPDAYRYPRFSPDGRRIAIGIQVTGGLQGDIWVLEPGSQRLSRVTADTSSAEPEWTPDGRSLVYSRYDRGIWEFYRVAADGSAEPQPFFSRRPTSLWEPHVTADGRHLVFREDAARTSRDVLVAPVDSPAAARPLAATAFNERAIALSPDGQMMAYVSNLSGSAEVYLRRLEDGSPRWRISTGGGLEPRWGPGGRELFYRSNYSVYAVTVGPGTEPRLGEPHALFGGRFMSSGTDVLYDVSPDGRQFVMVRDLIGGQGFELHVLLNAFRQRRRAEGGR